MGSNVSLSMYIENGDICGLEDCLAKLKNTDEIAMKQVLNEGLSILSTGKLKGSVLVRKEMLKAIVDAGGDIHAVDDEEKNCLHHACIHDNIDLVPCIIEAGCRSERDKYGLLPQDYLHASEKSNLLLETRRLLQHHTKRSEYGLFYGNNTMVDQMKHEHGEMIRLSVHQPGKSNDAGYIQQLYSINGEMNAGSILPLSTLQNGKLQFPTNQLPEDAVCYFIYVASDKNRMHRKIVASTNGIQLHSGVAKYTFRVNGVVFHHSNPKLHKMDFPDTNAFQQYLHP